MQKISLINKKIYPDYCHLHTVFHQTLRETLNKLDYQETWCPPLSSAPCFETHLHPFEVYSCKDKKRTQRYLHTSPEFILKNHLSILRLQAGSGCYNLNYVFRDDRPGPIHRQQFIMLEFYRTKLPTQNLIHDLSHLIKTTSDMVHSQYDSAKIENIEEVTIDALFQNLLNFSILDFIDHDELFLKICKDFPQNAPSQKIPWDDLYNLLWLNYIEPTLPSYQALLIKDFPKPVGLLAKEKENDPRISKRFELFIKGCEIANGYSEEASFQNNVSAIENHLKQKQDQYNYTLAKPDFLLKNLQDQGLPECYGVALGTERLLQVLTGLESAFIDFE